MKKKQILVVTILSVFFLSSSVSLATDRLVPSGYSTIQAAVDASTDGDTVIISPGTYYENVVIPSKNITLTSEDPNDSNTVTSTIINGRHADSAIHIDSNLVTVTVAGLTITNGFKKAGGGIKCSTEDGVNVYVRNCRITGNQTTDGAQATQYAPGQPGGDGAGIYCSAAVYLELTGCIIADNTCGNGGDAAYGTGWINSGGKGGSGGGIYCTGAVLKIKDCHINTNSGGTGGGGVYIGYDIGAPGHGGDGGGLYCANGSLDINDCTFEQNHAGDGGAIAENGNPGDGGEGGGICSVSSPANIRNSLVAANTSGRAGDTVEYYNAVGGDGGGIYITGPAVIENCIIIQNVAESWVSPDRPHVGGNGGGICCSDANITNCIITGNTISPAHFSGGGGGIYCSNTNIKNCMIADNTIGPSDYSNNTGGGGIHCTNTNIKNCTIADNTVGPSEFPEGGGGIHSDSGTSVTDSIIWNNNAPVYPHICGSPSVSYSDVQAGFAGTGNINADPCFVTGPSGDYYLEQIAAGQAGNSPCVDTGSDSAVNLGMDELTTRTDQVSEQGVVDMGYHYPVVYRSADIDENFFVNFFDFAIFGNNWQLSEPNLNSDFTKDSKVDFMDLLVLADAWLKCLVEVSSGPDPTNGATGLDPNMIIKLVWTAGAGALEHDVYLGTDANAVAAANLLSEEFMGTVSDVNFDPCVLDYHTTYFWRIDEVGPQCTTKGEIWNFTTYGYPDKATNPVPNDGATGLDPNVVLSWTAGAFTGSHDVYMGTDFNDVNNADNLSPEFKGNQTATSYDPCILDFNAIYFWRIDEKNPSGTTKGDIWSFTTYGYPGKANNPIPANGATNCDPNNTILSWTAGASASSHDVYMGTDFNDVNDADNLSPEFKGNQTATSYDPCDLDVNTTYFWRIDEKNLYGTTKGDIWNFKTCSGEIDPSLAGWWKFDEGSGTIANDSAGDNNGTVYNATWTTGQINGALSFDGSNDYVGVPDDDSLDMDNQMTISAWIKLNNLNKYYFIVTKQPSGTAGDNYPGNYEFRTQQTSGQLELLHQTGTGTTLATYASTSAVTTGVWQHVAVTLEEGVAVTFYINGEPAGTLPQTETFGIVNSSPVRIGRRKDTTVSFYGAIDDVHIYDRALSGAEVLQDYIYTSGQLQAFRPNPADGSINVNLTQDINWISGYGAISHDVYFGSVNPPPFAGNQTDTTYDTGTMEANTTYYWRIDEKDANGTIITGNIWSFTTVPPLPGQATDPVPANGATDVGRTQDLSWTAGSGATSHDVYFGTANPPPFKDNLAGTTYDTGIMEANTTYYWRIDEKNISGTTEGALWSFTTGTPAPGMATNPVPGNGYIGLDPNTVVLSWTAGILADSHDVYLGTDFNDVNDANISSPEFKGNQTATSYDPCDLDVNTTYFWRIDEKNSYGTTKGDIWNFKTGSGEIDPSLAGWWKFDEGSGTIANDSAGDNNGTVYNATWTTGQINGALSFDGTNDYVGVPDDDNSLDMDNQMTISAWIKVNILGRFHFIVTKQPSGTAGDSSPGNYEFRTQQTGGQLELLHQTGTASYQFVTYASTSAVTTGVWQHVAVTLEEGVAVKFYINGAPAGTLPQTKTFGIVNDEPVRIGKRKDIVTSLAGAIDDVRVYDRVLSDTEIQQLYNEGLNP